MTIITLEELRLSLVESAVQIQRGEFQDCDEAFDDIEVELFGQRLADLSAQVQGDSSRHETDSNN